MKIWEFPCWEREISWQQVAIRATQQELAFMKEWQQDIWNHNMNSNIESVREDVIARQEWYQELLNKIKHNKITYRRERD